MKKNILILIVVFLVVALLFKFSLELQNPTQDTHRAEETTEDYAKEPLTITLENGSTYEIHAQKIKQKIGNMEIERFAYNGQIPGPTLRIKQGSTVTIKFFNDLPEASTIHWHGIRHDVKDDGVPETSGTVPPGGTHVYTLHVPDAGIFWYHPHVREDRQQDMGLAGNIIVDPQDAQYWNPVDEEIVMMLDDILLDGGGIIPYGQRYANFAMMGRFGNVLLVNGKTSFDLNVKRGETIRFYITDSANVRPFNISFDNKPILLVASDLGKYQTSHQVTSIMLNPGERQVVEAAFTEDTTIYHITPTQAYQIGKIRVTNDELETHELQKEHSGSSQDELPSDKEFNSYLLKEPDYTFDIDSDMTMMGHGGMMMNGHIEKIEWEDPMSIMNSHMTSQNTVWILRDTKTGKKNMEAMMHAKVGDKLKIRIVNPRTAMHPMQHPIHLHGQRFLVLNSDGIINTNLVWKDTAPVLAGSTLDILVDVSNPGEWMFHCHIAEHLEAGMMTTLKVEEH